jgi:hypothetical protein
LRTLGAVFTHVGCSLRATERVFFTDEYYAEFTRLFEG